MFFSNIRSMVNAMVIYIFLAGTSLAQDTYVPYSPITLALLPGQSTPFSAEQQTAFIEHVAAGGVGITADMIRETRLWSPSFYTGIRLAEIELQLPSGMVAVMTLVLDDAGAILGTFSGNPIDFFTLAMENQLQLDNAKDALAYLKFFTRLVPCSSLRGFEENLPMTGIPDTCRIIFGAEDLIWYEMAPLDLSQAGIIDRPIVVRVPTGAYTIEATVLQGAALYNITFNLNHRSGIAQIVAAEEIYDMVPALAEIHFSYSRYFSPLEVLEN